MTSVAHNRMNVALALAIPAAAFLYLNFSDSSGTTAFAVSVMLGVGVFWVAAVVTLNMRWHGPGDRAGGLMRVDRPAALPTHIQGDFLCVSRPVPPWRWASLLLAPVELLLLAWSVPAVILLILAPVGLALASLLWLGRRLFGGS